MPWLHVRYRVADYARWKQVYDATAEFKVRYGWKRYRLYMVNGNRNDILAMDEFDTREQAEAFLGSDEFKAAMKQAGVSAAPEAVLLLGLEEGAP